MLDLLMNMINALRGAVSKNKRRFQDGDYDLDLTCILFYKFTTSFTYDW